MSIPENANLAEVLTSMGFAPAKFRHVKRGTTYTVLSMGEYHMSTISLEGSVHSIIINGIPLECTFQHSGQHPEGEGYRVAGYGGPITIYVGSDGKGWIRPTHEFLDGRFERIEN